MQAVPIAAVDERLAAVSAEISRLELERSILTELRKLAVVLGNGHSSHPTEVTGVAEDEDPGASGAILALIREQPGLTRAEIVSRLEGNIATNAVHPRRVIATTLVNLRRGRRVVEDENGGFKTAER